MKIPRHKKCIVFEEVDEKFPRFREYQFLYRRRGMLRKGIEWLFSLREITIQELFPPGTSRKIVKGGESKISHEKIIEFFVHVKTTKKV